MATSIYPIAMLSETVSAAYFSVFAVCGPDYFANCGGWANHAAQRQFFPKRLSVFRRFGESGFSGIRSGNIIMPKRFLPMLVASLFGVLPAFAGESGGFMTSEYWEYAETGPATAPLRRVTSNNSRQDEGGGGRTQVRVTIPSGGVRQEPRYKIVDSTENGLDGSIQFDLANGVAPEITDIPGVFTPDMLAMDAGLPEMEDSVYASFERSDVEVLAPMELAEGAPRAITRPDPVALPPPLGDEARPEEFSAMTAPAMPPISGPDFARAPRSRVPATSVRLPTRSPPTEVRLTDTGPGSPMGSLRPPPLFRGAPMPSPEEMRLTDVPVRSPRRGQEGMMPVAGPRPEPARKKEEPLPVGEDGFTPMRKVKNLYVPTPDPSLWGD